MADPQERVRGGEAVTELKPCPFCGATDGVNADMDYQVGIPVWVVDCPKCGMVGPPVDEKEGEAAAVEAWNRRTRPCPATAASGTGSSRPA